MLTIKPVFQWSQAKESNSNTERTKAKIKLLYKKKES